MTAFTPDTDALATPLAARGVRLTDHTINRVVPFVVGGVSQVRALVDEHARVLRYVPSAAAGPRGGAYLVAIARHPLPSARARPRPPLDRDDEPRHRRAARRAPPAPRPRPNAGAALT